MLQPQTDYAGFSEEEAKKALAQWLIDRADVHLTPEEFRGMFTHGDPLGSVARAKERKKWEIQGLDFLHCHSAIHRILDALNWLEQVGYARSITALTMTDPRRPDEILPAWYGLFATPEQKCVAVLRALGLNKEEATHV